MFFSNFKKAYEYKGKSQHDYESQSNKVEMDVFFATDYDKKKRAGKIIAYTRGAATCTVLTIDGYTKLNEELLDMGYTGKFCALYHWSGFNKNDVHIKSINDVFMKIIQQIRVIYDDEKNTPIRISSIWIIGGQKSGQQKEIGSEKEIQAYKNFLDENQKNNIWSWNKKTKQNLIFANDRLNVDIRPYLTEKANNLSVYFKLNKSGTPEVYYKKYQTNEKDSSSESEKSDDSDDNQNKDNSFDFS